eukprot:403350359
MGNSCKKCFQNRQQRIYPKLQPVVHGTPNIHNFISVDQSNLFINQEHYIFRQLDSDESDRNEVRVSMGWKVKRDNQTGKNQWQISERQVLDKNRRREIRGMSIDQVLLQRNNLCLEEKKIWMQKQLGKQRIPFVDDREVLIINRENLVQESFDAFQTFIDLNLHKELQIFFVGEKAQDAGGVEREWITQLVQGLMAPEFGLFRRLNGLQEVTYYFQVKKEESNKQLSWYYFLGQIIGKALFDFIPVNFPVCKALFKIMMSKNVKFTVDDLRNYDQQIYNSIKMISSTELSAKDIEALQLNFTVEIYDKNGQVIQSADLVPNGSHIYLNNENKQQFIDLFIDYHLRKCVQKQIDNFLQGFTTVIRSDSLKIFEDVDEFELLLCGSPFINLEDWQENTLYRESLNKNQDSVKWFWQTLDDLDQDQLRIMLQFCTGSTRVPIDGFKGLISNRGKLQKFTMIPSQEEGSQVIKAQTCFNRIYMPKFTSQEQVKQTIDNIIIHKDHWLYFDYE